MVIHNQKWCCCYSTSCDSWKEGPDWAIDITTPFRTSSTFLCHRSPAGSRGLGHRERGCQIKSKSTIPSNPQRRGHFASEDQKTESQRDEKEHPQGRAYRKHRDTTKETTAHQRIPSCSGRSLDDSREAREGHRHSQKDKDQESSAGESQHKCTERCQDGTSRLPESMYRDVSCSS